MGFPPILVHVPPCAATSGSLLSQRLNRDRCLMPAIVVRNLSPETLRALRARTAKPGRSTEAEVLSILDEGVPPDLVNRGPRLQLRTPVRRS
jgi:hypothetical protein